MPQLVPSHVALPLGSVGHGLHAAPHEVTLVSLAQRLPHTWLPLGHTPRHGAVASMQVPAQSFWVPGQVPPHCVPSQVEVPPVGGVHAMQAVPQEFTSELLTHTPAQRW